MDDAEDHRSEQSSTREEKMSKKNTKYLRLKKEKCSPNVMQEKCVAFLMIIASNSSVSFSWSLSVSLWSSRLPYCCCCQSVILFTFQREIVRSFRRYGVLFCAEEFFHLSDERLRISAFLIVFASYFLYYNFIIFWPVKCFIDEW